MINKYDAAEISKATADAFRTRVAHLRGEVSGEDYEAVMEVCFNILSPQVDNSQILDKQIDPVTGEAKTV